jgi:hypothetical protein
MILILFFRAVAARPARGRRMGMARGRKSAKDAMMADDDTPSSSLMRRN